jgi:hypothetical protein
MPPPMMQMSLSWTAIGIPVTMFNAELAMCAEKIHLCELSGLCVDRRQASGAGRFVVIWIGRHTSRLICAL